MIRLFEKSQLFCNYSWQSFVVKIKGMSMRWLISILLSLALISCEEQFGVENGEIPKNALEHSKDIFPGKVLEKSTAVIDNVSVWKIRIENNTGAIVTFYWQKNYTILFRIEGEKGPFSYDLKPPLNLIILSTARFLAFESYSDEELESWQLIRDKSNNMQWVYQFFLVDHEKPISINATTGDIL